MNLKLTEFYIKNPKLSFLKKQLNQLTDFNINIPVYKFDFNYLFYIGLNKNDYAFLEGCFSFTQRLIIIANKELWFINKINIKFINDNLYYNNDVYKLTNNLIKYKCINI